jgi:hypothetical protein
MTRERPLPPEVRALLAHEREITPLPTATRARAIARARAALVAGVDRATPAPVRNPRWAAAAALFCILGGAAGAAAYQFRAYIAPRPDIHPIAVPVKAVAAVRPVAPAAIVDEAPTASAASAASAASDKPVLSKADAARAELRLLRQARAAVAREDYASALRPIAEHAHRFKDGRLSEEREALRVKSLAGLGRTDDARRAATAFRARFPRSVLLSAVNKLSPSEP